MNDVNKENQSIQKDDKFKKVHLVIAIIGIIITTIIAIFGLFFTIEKIEIKFGSSNSNSVTESFDREISTASSTQSIPNDTSKDNETVESLSVDNMLIGTKWVFEKGYFKNGEEFSRDFIKTWQYNNRFYDFKSNDIVDFHELFYFDGTYKLSPNNKQVEIKIAFKSEINTVGIIEDNIMTIEEDGKKLIFIKK